MTDNKLAQLVDTYQSKGWEHFETWINQQMDRCFAAFMNPMTPEEDLKQTRALAQMYKSILDKVRADKENYKQTQKAE